MATNEFSGFLKYKDGNGDINLLMPITTVDNVDGMDEIQEELSSAVKFTEQTLTDEQKAQARDNIGCATPNWNTPEGEPGHVLNRTHYESVGLKEILSTTEHYFDTENGTFSNSFMLVEGEVYTVTWDGEAYECTAIKTDITGNTKIVIGDTGMWGIGESNNMPFVIWADLNGNTGADVTTWNVTHTFSIAMHENVLKRLDGKFLPEGLPYSETTTIEIVPETTYTFTDGSVQMEGQIDLEVGQEYIVTWNGTDYTLTSFETTYNSMPVLAVGNMGLFGGTDTGEPFIVGNFTSMNMWGFGTNLAETTHTASIKKVTEIVKTLDPKFLPEHLPYSEIVQGNPTFDGNLNGREYTQVGDTQYLVKMSDQILSVADLVGATVVFHDITEDTDEELVLTEEMVMDASSEGIPGILVSDGLVFCVQSDFSMDGLTLTAGVHFMYIVNGGYVKSLSCVDATTEKIHKLDGKYLPDGLPYSETEVLEPTFDGNINGREVYNLGGMGFVKVSEQSLTTDDLVNATIVGNLGGEIQELTITSDMIAAINGVAYVQYGDAMLVLYVSPENDTLDMTPGVYFLNVPGEGYAMSLSCLTEPIVKETIHKIDPKFLPSTLPDVTTDDNGKVLQVVEGVWTTQKLSYSDIDGAVVVPNPSTATEGAFLRIVDGAWAAVVLPNVEDGEF